jgi:hypothetical protein
VDMCPRHVSFSTNALVPAGADQSFMWVQLIDSVQKQHITPTGQYVTPTSPGSGLDTSHPCASVSPRTTYDIDEVTAVASLRVQ